MKSPAHATPFDELVRTSKKEMDGKSGNLTIALEWREQEVKAILKGFKKAFPFVKEFTVERERQAEQFQRLLLEIRQGKIPYYDILHISTELWPDFKKEGLFVKPPFDYHQLVKTLPSGWDTIDPRAVDPQGYFMATTALARGIAYHKELVPPAKAPQGWSDCLDPAWSGKFLYDPRPKLTALYHDPKTREAHLQWLRGAVNNKMVLNRGQTENLMKLAAGEYLLFCGVNYHSAMRLIDKGAPIQFFFPDPFPLDIGTELHVLKWSKTPATTQLFALWLASEGQGELETHGYRGFPWSLKSRKYPLAKGKYVAVCGVECVHKSEQAYFKLHAEILKLPGIH